MYSGFFDMLKTIDGKGGKNGKHTVAAVKSIWKDGRNEPFLDAASHTIQQL
jgi:hypothetical protein